MRNRRNPGRPGTIDRALSASHPRVAEAWEIVHEILADLGIPHVVVGGVAYSAYADPRATRDVDFLVPPDTALRASRGGLIVVHAPGVPIEVGGVKIDYLEPTIGEDGEDVLAAALDGVDPADVVVLDPARIVLMKLAAGRAKDHADVVGLLYAGIDPREVDELLTACDAPDVWWARWRRACREATSADG